MKIDSEFHIEAPAEASWRVIGEAFGEIGTWASAIRTSRLDGPLAEGVTRTCAIGGFGPIKDGGEVHEKLFVFDPAERNLAYRVTSGLPPMIRQAANHWTVRAEGPNASVITSRATLRLAWWMRPMTPLLKWRIRADVRRLGEELRHRIEQGVPHPRKHASASAAPERERSAAMSEG